MAARMPPRRPPPGAAIADGCCPFGLTFLVALLVGRVWNFSRPAEFRTSTRVQVNLPEVGRPGQSASAAFGTKLQLFDSRPMLARLVPQAAQDRGVPEAPALARRSLPAPGSVVLEVCAARKTFGGLVANNDVGNLAACLEKLAHDLVPRVRQFCHRAHHEHPTGIAPALPPPVLRPPSSLAGTKSRFGGDRGPFDLLCISTSTGGPNALAEVFAGFKAPLPVPVAIVQHMPPMFTAMLAERLDRGPGPMHCLEATEGLRLAVGTAVLAPGGRHLAIARDGGGSFIAHLTDEPPENSCRPSADIMLRTAAATGARILSVVMTGMGHDGLRGCMHVHEAGGSLVIQDQASSVVWGMPGSVAASGLPHRGYPLSDLAPQIERQLATHLVLIA